MTCLKKKKYKQNMFTVFFDIFVLTFSQTYHSFP